MSTSDRFPPFPDPDDRDPETRQCRGCGGYFAVDDTPLGVDHPNWWLCPACQNKITGPNPTRRR